MMTTYSHNDLDRMDHLRGSEPALNSMSNENTCKYLILCEGKVAIKKDFTDSESLIFSQDEVENIITQCVYKVFLGSKDDTLYFALSFNQRPNPAYMLMDAKELAQQNVLSDENLGIIAQAAGIINWHKSHSFCSHCGSTTHIAHHGWRRECSNCQIQHFPRIDPVVIMLVTCDDYCLLGAGIHFQNKRYSCLAGFMEPGETIEAAAARELYEEAGITGDKAQYITSQPWPFPSNLMIGVHINTQQKELAIDKNELTDAIWVHRSDIKATLKGDSATNFTLPNKYAIAHTLLSYWVNQ